MAAACALSPAAARAFCRTAALGEVKGCSVCTPPTAEDCGTPIAWPNPCVGFSIQQDASAQIPLEVARDTVEKAFDAWMTADCGSGVGPHVRVQDMGAIPCAAREYNRKATTGNANLIVFRDDEWPDPDKSKIALTTVTYNPDTAEIYDADIEVNTHVFTFKTDGSSGSYDLLSVLTHETGHFLGLDHSLFPEATMTPSYPIGKTWLRDLTPDDVAGICDIYPPDGAVPADCSPEIRHCYSPLCGADQTECEGGGGEGCSCRAPAAPGSGAAALALSVLALGSMIGRRARRR